MTERAPIDNPTRSTTPRTSPALARTLLPLTLWVAVAACGVTRYAQSWMGAPVAQHVVHPSASAPGRGPADQPGGTLCDTWIGEHTCTAIVEAGFSATVGSDATSED